MVKTTTGDAVPRRPGDPRVVAVVGPTAAGKSALSLQLAHELDGEVVNADSMQLYRGMDIGTAKLTTAERHGVPHHVLDLWDVTEPASVAEYQREARAAIDAILARGRTPLLVGGSGLYVRAVLEHFDFPGTDAQLRARLEDELARIGAEALHEQLPPPRPYYDAVQLGLDLEPAALDDRVRDRVDAMWAAGLVDEVRVLAGRG